MKKHTGILCAVVILFSTFFSVGYMTGNHAEREGPNVKIITIDDYHRLIDEKKDFVLYVGRASCKFCSITTLSLQKFSNQLLPVYELELEPYYQTTEYDEIKEELGVVYVPSFKYIEDGEIKYHMNSPLEGNYFADDSDRNAIRLEIEEKIQAFIYGAAGVGSIIDEVVLTDEIIAEPIVVSGGEDG